MDKTLNRFLDLAEKCGMWEGVASGMVKVMILSTIRRNIPQAYARIDDLCGLWQRAKEESE